VGLGGRCGGVGGGVGEGGFGWGYGVFLCGGSVGGVAARKGRGGSGGGGASRGNGASLNICEGAGEAIHEGGEEKMAPRRFSRVRATPSAEKK